MRQANTSQVLPSGGMLQQYGPEAGPPLFFLHGVGGGAWSWRPQVAEFADRRPCFVWEARGHGSAARVADAGLGDYYVDAQEGLAAVRAATRESIAVVGHSMGGLLAIALAARFPEQIGHLALIDPVYPDAEQPSGHDLGLLTPLAIGVMRPLVASFLSDGWLARRLARWMFANAFTDRERMEAAWVDQRMQVPIEYPKMFFEAFGQPENFPVEPFARAIDVPTLVVNARSKELVATLAARLGSRFDDARITAGHYVQLDRPHDVNERLRLLLGEGVLS